GLAGALLLSLATGFVLVLGLWLRAEESAGRAEANFRSAEAERARAEASLVEADRQRARAEESFQQAHRAVNDFSTRVSQELGALPGPQPLRKKLLETALAYYQAFLRQRGQEEALRAELADAHARVAALTREVGTKAAALAAFRQNN